MKCLNLSSPLVRETLPIVKSEPLLAKILDGLGENPSVQEVLDSYADMYEKSPEASKAINQKIMNFLDKLGVNVRAVDTLRDAEGKPLTGIAKADLLNKVVDVVHGKADVSTLPEEAAHFFVEMLDDSNPLLQEMMGKITSYSLYGETVQEYKTNPLYRLPGGGINFPKIKKEAIGKLIGKYIVTGSLEEETAERMNFFTKWWDKLWSFITGKFFNLDSNPFQEAAARIIEGDTTGLSEENITDSEFLQISNPVDRLKDDQQKIRLDNSVDPITKQKRHVYYYGDKKVKGSVTTTKVDAYYKKKFPVDYRSESKKELDLLKAEYGDMIHSTIEEIMFTYVDPQTNKLRGEPVASRSKYAGTVFYNTLDSYVRELISLYPGATFMTEVKIYDPTQDIAGSIDLLIVDNKGTAHIYDWKSQEISKDKDELSPVKQTAYRIQLQEYKDILKKVYGLETFGKIRAIPIKTNFDYTKTSPTERVLNGLNSLEIGTVNPEANDPTKDYLLPVTLKEEDNDDANLAQMIDKLNDLLARFEKKEVKASERLQNEEKLGRYRKAIRDLQLKKDIRRFIQLGSSEVARYQKLIKNNELTIKDAMESLDILKVFTGTTFFFKNYMSELRKAQNEAPEQWMKDQYQNIINSYNSLNSNADIAVKEMEIAIEQLGKQLAYSESGITDLMTAEKKIGTLSQLFNSISQFSNRTFRVVYRLISDAQGKRDATYRTFMGKMEKVKAGYEAWAQSKGLSGEKMFDILLDFDEKGQWTGNLLRRVSKEYGIQKKKALASGDFAWLEANTEFDKQAYEKQLKSYTEYVMNQTYDQDPDVNNAERERAVNNWILRHNVNAQINGEVNQVAWLNPRNRFLKPKDQWVTNEWKRLHSPENKAALDFYNLIQELMRKSEHLGMLDEYSPEFVPSIYKSKLDQVVFGGSVFNTSGFMESLQVDVGDNYTPEVDPITGQIINRIPVHFKKDIGEEREDGTVDYSKKSRDLFKVFSIWAGQTASYEAMSEIEEEVNLMVHIERNKKTLVTDNFGRVKEEGGKAKEAKGNERNAELLEGLSNFYLYNRLSGQMSDVKFTVNGKEYSGNKALRWFINFFSLKTLALNPISGTAQFVGGTGNALFTAAKKNIFTTRDWVTSTYQITKRDPKTLALLYAADVLLEDRKQQMNEKMSVSKVVQFNTLDKLYIIQRVSDKAVQYPVAIATMINHMVEADGSIVDITKKVKKEFNYDTTYYSLSESERKTMREKIDARVKELKEKNSIYATAKIEKDTIVIPGVDLNGETWNRFRNKIKQVNKTILGNSTRDDINFIRTNQLGMAVMQFRSWMPQMVKERFGKLSYNQDLEMYTMGKTRLFFSELFKHPMAIAQSLIKSSGTNIIEAAKATYILERASAIEEGREFNISEAEFIDMYIGNIRSQLRELAMIIGIVALVFTTAPGGDDEEDEATGLRAYFHRALTKYQAEFMFYYDPSQFTSLVNAPFPVIGLANDFFSFSKNTVEQFFGYTTGDEEIQEDAKPMKYASRMLPILKEAILMRAIFDEDFKREWDIRL